MRARAAAGHHRVRPCAELSGAEGRHVGRARLQVPHRRGDARIEAGLPHGGRAERRAGNRAARHERLQCEHADGEFRRRAVRPWAGPGCDQVLHRAAGRHRPRQVIETVRRHARQVPALQLQRHGAGAVPARHRGAGPQARAPRHRQLDGRHARVAVG